MKNFLKDILSVFKTAALKWWEKDPFRESAVIAYYTIFSLPGLLVLIVTFAGYVFGQDVVNEHVQTQIKSALGADAAKQINEMIIVTSEKKRTVLATIIGGIVILIGATGVFAQFQKSLNMIWEVKADSSKSGIWQLIRVRLFSFGLIVAIAFILIVSLVISTMLSAFGTWLADHFSESLLVIVRVVSFIVSLCIISVLFALMFKFFPDAKIKWRQVLIGSVVTAILFEIGKFALGFYFGKADPVTAYGAAGSIVLILLWVSYSSMIVFYGAEFTCAYAKLKDGPIKPDSYGVKQPSRPN